MEGVVGFIVESDAAVEGRPACFPRVFTVVVLGQAVEFDSTTADYQLSAAITTVGFISRLEVAEFTRSPFVCFLGYVFTA